MDHWFVITKTLECLDIAYQKANPTTCSCFSTTFNYNPSWHVITGDVNIVNDDDLYSLIFKSPNLYPYLSFNGRNSSKLYVSVFNISKKKQQKLIWIT